MMDTTEGKIVGRAMRRVGLIAGTAIAAVALAACGSSSDGTTSGAGSTSAESDTGKAADSGGGNPETTVYAKGVPTLEELYEGSEESPPTSGPKAVPGKSVVVISCGEESPGCVTPTEQTAEAAEVLGWKAKILDGKLNVNDGYANAIRTAIASEPDGILLMGIGCGEAKSAIEEGNADGIAILSFGGFDCSEEGSGKASENVFALPQMYNKGAENNTEFYRQFGENQAAYVVDATEGKAKVIGTGFRGRPSIAEGWENVFSKCAECEILENIEFDAAESLTNGPLYQKFVTALTKYPEANAAILAFDSVATQTGGSKAIMDSGRAAEIVAVAAEGYPETIQLIEEEKGLTAEGAAYSSGWTGWGLADELNRYFAGQDPVPAGVGFTVIDKDHNLPPKGDKFDTSVDYKAAYEAIWNAK